MPFKYHRRACGFLETSCQIFWRVSFAKAAQNMKRIAQHKQHAITSGRLGTYREPYPVDAEIANPMSKNTINDTAHLNIHIKTSKMKRREEPKNEDVPQASEEGMTALYSHCCISMATT
jgi:hypothetical protein